MNNKRLGNFLSLFTSAVMLLVSPAALSSEWLYSARPGDTLWDLCEKYTVKKVQCWRELGQYNGINYPKKTVPGDIIRFPTDWLKDKPKPVIVRHVIGDVSVTFTKGENAVELQLGDRLPVGSLIKTGIGNTTLLFGSGGQILLEQNSQLLLDSISIFHGSKVVDSRLRLNHGSVKTKVPVTEPKSRFSITTPAAVAAVRGTEFRVSYDSSQRLMRSEVFEGVVNVATSLDQKNVGAGYAVLAQRDKPLGELALLLTAPEFTMDKVQMNSLVLRWSKVQSAVAYSLELMNNNDDEELLATQIISGQGYDLQENIVKCYRVRIRAIDEREIKGLSSSQTVCKTKQLEIPMIKSIESVGKNEVEMSWNPIAGAKGYRIELSQEEEFDHILSTHVASAEDLELRLPVNQSLYMRIQTIGEMGGTTEFSEPIYWSNSHIDLTLTLFSSLIVLILML